MPIALLFAMFVGIFGAFAAPESDPNHGRQRPPVGMFDGTSIFPPQGDQGETRDN